VPVPSSNDSAAEPAREFEQSLRPPDFEEFCGQAKVKERLMLMVEAAKGRNDALDHVLLCGPPGLGKTTLAHILSRAFGSDIHVTSGPQIEKAGDLAGILTNVQHGDFLFIDEIHRLHPAIEEYLYPAMEDFKAGMLTRPLLSRFGITNRLDYYSPEELVIIIRRSAALLGVPIEKEGALEIGSRSRGTPRIANGLLRWVRDYAQVRADNVITLDVARAALSMLDIDEDGLDEMDKRILEAVIYKYSGGPVGLNSIAVAVGEDEATINEVYEPYLILKGYLKRTPRGRSAMPLAYRKLGLTPPSGSGEETLNLL
jgi:Holliday junction DNA helicase RuvB